MKRLTADHNLPATTVHDHAEPSTDAKAHAVSSFSLTGKCGREAGHANTDHARVVQTNRHKIQNTK